jgi:hypothetical protein
MNQSLVKPLRLTSVPLCLCGSILVFTGSLTLAQVPRINTFFPIGGKAGTTVEVEIRGSSLSGAEKLLVSGKGVTGTIQPGAAKVDEQFRPLFQSKCQGCHELRSPANRSMSPAQWAATVDRMVRVRQAPISSDESGKITQYLQSAARAGRLTAQVQIAADAQPGLCEIRIANGKGASTAALFEIGNRPEVLGTNGKLADAQPVSLPCIANGTLAGNAERHYYKFAAKKGQRLVFDLKGFRYNESSQLFFNPNLRLYDAAGTEIVENHGYYDLDPLIDWVCPADGDYTLEVRDLLGRGNPGSVYRLTMGPVPYDTVLFPAAAPPGKVASLTALGKNLPDGGSALQVAAPPDSGMVTISTPFGSEPLYITSHPIVRDDAVSTPIALPACFTGRLAAAGEADSFTVTGNGAYEIEVFADRLGSPAQVRVAVLGPNGRPVVNVNGDSRGTVNLEAGKSYTLKVAEAEGKGGSDFVYCVEVRPVQPLLLCAVRPDNITVRAGSTTAVEVVVLRRERVEGNVEVVVEGLSAGVTAASVLITPDRQTGYLLLTASADAALADQPVRIIARARGVSAEVKTQATPQETYLLNNQPRYVDRDDCFVSVRPPADFTAQVVSDLKAIQVHPRRGTPVKVSIARKPGFSGPVTVRIVGLPQGWVAGPETVAGDKTEVSLLVRPDGNNTNPFLNRDASLPPIVAVVEAVQDDYPTVVAALVVNRAERVDDDGKP